MHPIRSYAIAAAALVAALASQPALAAEAEDAEDRARRYDRRQAVLNLLVNAAHAIHNKLKDHSKGLIQVRTRKQGNIAQISVTDNGTGIPEEIRSRIFDPFFTTKEVGKGTGQGLSIAYAIVVKKHSGKLRFESALGKGTTFFIEIPIDPTEHRSAKAATQP